MELEVDITKKIDEMNIERIINFSEILLDCGRYKNKLCHAQNYPQIEALPFFKKKLTKVIPTNPDIKCLTIPFFENSYKMSHEKIAYICIYEMRQLIQLIDFKNSLSRAIEGYQYKLGQDRFSSFNGLRRTQQAFFYFLDNKPKQVLARLYGKRIDLITNDKSAGFVADFSLYQSRFGGVYYVSDALTRGYIPLTWNKHYELPTLAECCLVLTGEKSNLILCAASNDGKTLESASDICRVKLNPFKALVRMQLRGIQLVESSYELLSNSKKFNNCKAKEFKVFKKRIIDLVSKEAMSDCRNVINYVQINSDEKLRYCIKHVGDEVKMELMLLAGDSSSLYNRLSDCTYRDSDIKSKLTEKYLMKKLNIRPSSFIQANEVDEIDSDDDAAVEINKKVALSNNTDKNSKISFTQLKEKMEKPKKKGKNKKMKEIEKIMYLKKKPQNNSDNVRKKLFRIKEMNNIQNNHHWRHKGREGMTKEYSKVLASQGNKNADTFVGFLGFLRDSSSEGSQSVYNNQIKKFFAN